MARDFAGGGGDYLDFGTGGGVGASGPWSVVARVNPDGVTNRTIICKRDGFSVGTNQFELSLSGSATPVFTRDGQFEVTNEVVSTSVWSNLGVAGDASGSYGYLNSTAWTHGGGAGFGADWSSGSNTNQRLAIGIIVGTGQNFDGRIAEVALWNAKLTTAELLMFTVAQASPLMIRPASLVMYTQLIGNNSPETDYVGGLSGTITGTVTKAAHPLVIMPRGRKRLTNVGAVYVYMRPDADSSDGSWLNELGSNVDLYASVDETVASDADYIQSSTTSGDKVRLRLSDPSSGVAQPFAIRYRAYGVSGTASLFGRLYQGASTLIDSWSHTVDTTPADYTHTLGSTEFALITDFNDLFIEFEYTP